MNLTEKKPIYNPDLEDFSVTYDINGDGQPVLFTAPALEISYFEPVVADHIAKHLANHLHHVRGIVVNPSADLEALKKEITEIHLDGESNTD